MKRRGFLFGAIAAPTIIGIDGKMKFFVPPTPKIITHPFHDDFTTDNLRFKVTERYAAALIRGAELFGTRMAT